MYKTIIKIYILIISMFSTLAVNAADGITLDDLDKVLRKAGSLNAFLESKPLQQEYLDLSIDYYGHNFSLQERQESYWVIIEQMKKAVKSNPVLGQRLWSTQDLGTTFKMDANITQRGVDLKSLQYKRAWEKYAASEGQKVERIPAPDREKHIKEEAKKLAQWIDEQKSKIESEFKNSNLPRSQRESAKGKAYSELQKKVLAHNEFQKLKSNLVLELIEKEAFGDILNTGDANIILDFLEKFRAKSANMFGIKGLESVLETLHPYLIKAMPETLVKPEVPRLVVKDGKPASTEFFTVKTKQVKVRDATGNVISTKLIPEGTSGGALELKAIPRRFHAAFKGIELGECVAGGSCRNVSMERWAAPSLEGSHHYYVEAGDQYKGWVSLFPGELEGKKVSNIEFGSNILKQSSEFKGKAYPLYEHMMVELKSRMPKGTNKFLVGDSSAINNAEVLPHVQSSTSYALGEDIHFDYDKINGTYENRFRHKDQSTLDFIAEERATQKQSQMYSGKGGIIDVNQSENKNTILNDNYFLNEQFKAEDEALLIKKIKSGHGPALKYASQPDFIHKTKVVDAVFEFVKSNNYGDIRTALRILTDPINFKKKDVFEHLVSEKYIGVEDVLKRALGPEYINDSRVIKALDERLRDADLIKFSPHVVGELYKEVANYIDNKNILGLFDRHAADGLHYSVTRLALPEHASKPGVLDIIKKYLSNKKRDTIHDGLIAENLMKSLDNPNISEFIFNQAKESDSNVFYRLLGQTEPLQRSDVLEFFKDSVRKGSKASIMLLGRDEYIDLPGVIDALKDRLKIEHANNLEPYAQYGLVRYKKRPEVASVLPIMRQHCATAALKRLIEKSAKPR